MARLINIDRSNKFITNYLIQHGHRSTNFKASGMVGTTPASWFDSVTSSSDSRSGVGVASPVENRASSPSSGTRFD